MQFSPPGSVFRSKWAKATCGGGGGALALLTVTDFTNLASLTHHVKLACVCQVSRCAGPQWSEIMHIKSNTKNYNKLEHYSRFYQYENLKLDLICIFVQNKSTAWWKTSLNHPL